MAAPFTCFQHDLLDILFQRHLLLWEGKVFNIFLTFFNRFLWCLEILVFKFFDSKSPVVSPKPQRSAWALGAVGVLAAVSAGRARGSKASRAARVVAAASKVDTVCILGCAGAVGQDAAAWWCQGRSSYAKLMMTSC